MAMINSIHISPALLNSSCAWSSNLRDLQELYDSSYTGAITTRTATLSGFKQDESHTVVFANSSTSALNSYGYSPYTLTEYLAWVKEILQQSKSDKPIVISITSSTPDGLQSMVSSIQDLRRELNDVARSPSRIAIELNTSCPNIRHASPSGYSFRSLGPLLEILANEYAVDSTLTIGLKLPPFVVREQFVDVLDTLSKLGATPSDSISENNPTCPISFLTCTNTLGNALLYQDQVTFASPAANGSGNSQFAVPTALGGLSGDALHALALGNVYTFSQLIRGGLEAPLANTAVLSDLRIIGVGGVTCKQARERMRKAGADAVACATFYGKEGVRAFELLTDTTA